MMIPAVLLPGEMSLTFTTRIFRIFRPWEAWERAVELYRLGMSSSAVTGWAVLLRKGTRMLGGSCVHLRSCLQLGSRSAARRGVAGGPRGSGEGLRSGGSTWIVASGTVFLEFGASPSGDGQGRRGWMGGFPEVH